jgi:hypothetical protein
MQVNPSNQSPMVNGITGRGPVRDARLEQDKSTFVRSDALNRALAATPEVRPEMVQNARKLVADPPYPPPEAIRRLSHLLVNNIAGSEA